MMPVVTSSANPQGRSDPGLQRLLSSLDQLKARASGDENDLSFLREFLQANDFQSLVKVHEKVTTPESHENKALSEDACDVLDEVCDELEEKPYLSGAQELLEVLQEPHMLALLEAHDQVATRDFDPPLPDIPYEVDEDEESVKIVRLVKGNTEPLVRESKLQDLSKSGEKNSHAGIDQGATIKMNERTGTIHIARIMHGGAADRCGLIHVGDEVLAVNGLSVKGKEPNEIVQILADTLGPITLKLTPCEDFDMAMMREAKVRMRAHFSYDPSEDKLIPCKEAGLAFKRGDILQIVSQDDDSWWQARKEGDRNMRAGLIPARQLMERKLSVQKSVETSPKSNKGSKTSTRFSPKLGKKSKRTKKIIYHAIQNEDYDSEEIVAYEEVEKYYPKVGRYRPILLIGPPCVGRNELKQRLIATNNNLFKSTIPHTSRPRQEGEVDGEDCNFVARTEMEADITTKRFVEYSESKGHLYGTSIEAVRSVVNSGHVCVLCPHPQALKLLRTAELKPFVVFVKPPPFDELKQTRSASSAKSSSSEKTVRTFTEDELHEMIACSNKMEAVYAHYADLVITNSDLEAAVDELVQAVHQIETEPQWVPAVWIQ